MPVTERYQADIFAIVTLIAAVLVLVFLIIAAVYFGNVMNSNFPSNTESSFLFWTAIIMSVIFFIIVIYAFFLIFSYKIFVYEPDRPVTEVALVQPPQQVLVQPPPQQVLVQPPPQQVLVQMPPETVRLSNIPITSLPSNYSQNLSDIPITPSQRAALNQQLISLQ